MAGRKCETRTTFLRLRPLVYVADRRFSSDGTHGTCLDFGSSSVRSGPVQALGILRLSMVRVYGRGRRLCVYAVLPFRFFLEFAACTFYRPASFEPRRKESELSGLSDVFCTCLTGIL